MGKGTINRSHTRIPLGREVLYETSQDRDTNPDGQRLWPSEVLWLLYARLARHSVKDAHHCS
jgi:hypothetical protein